VFVTSRWPPSEKTCLTKQAGVQHNTNPTAATSTAKSERVTKIAVYLLSSHHHQAHVTNKLYTVPGRLAEPQQVIKQAQGSQHQTAPHNLRRWLPTHNGFKLVQRAQSGGTTCSQPLCCTRLTTADRTTETAGCHNACQCNTTGQACSFIDHQGAGDVVNLWSAPSSSTGRSMNGKQGWEW